MELNAWSSNSRVSTDAKVLVFGKFKLGSGANEAQNVF